MKVAIVHDWLTGMRGGERCLEQFINLYPQADIFTLVHIPGSTIPSIDQRVKKVSFLSKLPGVKRYYRALLPLFPFAIRSFDFEGYDLIISLSHAAAKNIRKPKNAKHVCYCFTPMRYVWDQRRFYFGALTPLLFPITKSLQIWDKKGAESVDHFIAISRFVAARIKLFYGRKATVIFPPIEERWLQTPLSSTTKGKSFLYAGALVPYKRPELVIEAFNELGEPLDVVGDGPLLNKLKESAKPNIRFLGRVNDQELAECYQKARALIFPGIEDFGMIPVECMASGTPIIALGKGGTKESVKGLIPGESSLAVQNSTGVFIERRKYGSKGGLIDSVRYFLSVEDKFNSNLIREHARSFGLERFVSQWRDFAKEHDVPLGQDSSIVDRPLIAIGAK